VHFSDDNNYKKISALAIKIYGDLKLKDFDLLWQKLCQSEINY